jgi:hypothetical protein
MMYFAQRHKEQKRHTIIGHKKYVFLLEFFGTNGVPLVAPGCLLLRPYALIRFLFKGIRARDWGNFMLLRTQIFCSHAYCFFREPFCARLQKNTYGVFSEFCREK